MLLPWRARQYERVCRDCGYRWRVPREFAHTKVIAITGATSGLRSRGGAAYPLTADVRRGRAFVERVERLRICAKCGATDYAQRPVRAAGRG